MTAEETKDSENSTSMASNVDQPKQQVFQENQKLLIAQSEDLFDKKQYSGEFHREQSSLTR